MNWKCNPYIRINFLENGITREIFAKTNGTVVLDFSSTQTNMGLNRRGTVGLEFTFAKTLEQSVALTSLNQFETYWEITSDGRILLDLVPWT